jgi:hypothetical protein
MEPGSESIEARDLTKEIYIGDLEHASRYWDDWEGFERLVLDEKLGNGKRVSAL